MQRLGLMLQPLVVAAAARLRKTNMLRTEQTGGIQVLQHWK